MGLDRHARSWLLHRLIMLGKLSERSDVSLRLRAETRLIVLLRVNIRLVLLSKRLCLRTVEMTRLCKLVLSLANQGLKPTLMRKHFTLLIRVQLFVLIGSLEHSWISRLSVRWLFIQVCATDADWRQNFIVLRASDASILTLLRFDVKSRQGIWGEIWAFDCSLGFDLVFLLGGELVAVWLVVEWFYLVDLLAIINIQFIHQHFLQCFVINKYLILNWLVRLKHSLQISEF